MDRLDLLAVQGTLKSLLQHHSLRASVLRCSAFFIVQLSHPYMTTRKTIALTRRTFVGKIMSLLFNMLSRFIITFLPRSKCLLISWLQSPSSVILKPPPQNKVCHCFHCFPIYFPWSDGTSAVVQYFEHSLALPFFGIGMKTDFFQSCGHCWVFQICWHIECSTFTASSFRNWNSSTGIPSPPLALQAHLISYSRMSGSRWVITPSWLSGSWRSFFV